MKDLLCHFIKPGHMPGFMIFIGQKSICMDSFSLSTTVVLMFALSSHRRDNTPIGREDMNLSEKLTKKFQTTDTEGSRAENPNHVLVRPTNRREVYGYFNKLAESLVCDDSDPSRRTSGWIPVRDYGDDARVEARLSRRMVTEYWEGLKRTYPSSRTEVDLRIVHVTGAFASDVDEAVLKIDDGIIYDKSRNEITPGSPEMEAYGEVFDGLEAAYAVAASL